MGQQIKFSLIIGSYNPKQEWLDRALNSARGQFDEIILVDDGSEPEIPLYPDVIQIRNSFNKGFYQAKNIAIQVADGDVIAILDDDDYFYTEQLKILQSFVKDTYAVADVWHFHLQEFGGGSSIYGVNATPQHLSSYNSIPGISWFKKSLWVKNGGFTYPLAEDWDFWLRSYVNGATFQYFPRTVYAFNRRPDSVSARWTGEKFEKMRKEILERSYFPTNA